MKIQLFKKGPDSVLGVDVGTASIRAVELSQHGQQEKLENYVRITPPAREPRFLGGAGKGKLLFSDQRIAEMLKKSLLEAGIESERAYFSIPDFSTFFTTFSLPPMKKEEVEDAVRFEARQRVPMPIREVTLDWVLIKGEYSPRAKERLEILLVVVPNRVIDRYTNIAELADLQLKGVEAEVFAIQRAVARDERNTVGLIDIGVQSTTVSIIDEGILKNSYSFDIAGHDLTYRITKTMNLSFEKAEIMKENKGVLSQEVKKALDPVLGDIIEEIRKASDSFYGERGGKVTKFIIAGGTAAMPGLEKYFIKELGSDIEISFPFQGMVYPSILEKELLKISPGFTIATGVALKGLK